MSIGNPALIIERSRSALDLLPRGSIEWFQAAGLLARALGQTGSPDHFEAIAEDILAAPRSPGATATFASAVMRVCTHLIVVGRCDRGAAYHDEAERFITDADRADPHVRGARHSTQARIARHRGDLQGFLDEWRSAAAAYELAGDLRSSAIPWVNVGFALLELGEYQQAIDVLERVDELAERLRMDHVRSGALNNLGLALARAGRTSEGLAVETRALELCLAQDDRRLAASTRYYIAAILTMTGDLDAALTEAKRAVEVAGEYAPIRAGAMATLAKVQLALGHPDEAYATASAAAELRNRIAVFVDDDAGLSLVLARSLEALQRLGESREVILAARTRLLARADLLRDPRLRERFLAVADHAETLHLARAWDS
jgi:tetratricopeptide (TPR) repeat protein